MSEEQKKDAPAAAAESQEEKTPVEVPAKFKSLVEEIEKMSVLDLSELVKKLWDEDTYNNIPLKVIILGSSPWFMQKGLSESLAGRFEIIPITHWGLDEMQQAFGFDLDQYIYFGGYPGAAPLAK